MKRMLYTLLVGGLLTTALWAESGNEGKTGLAFLKVGAGARAGGMGEAFAAVADDAFATYWNPAGLLGASQSNLVFMHNEWLFDVNSEFGAAQFRGNNSSFAFHVYSFNIGDIEVRTAPTRDPLEETSAHYLSLGFSYARPLSEQLETGLTVKYLYEKIFVYDAGGVGIDLGFRYKGLLNNLIVAGTLQNLGKMGSFRSEESRLPLLARLGGSYVFPEFPGGVHLLLAGDLVKSREDDLRIHLGAEAGLWEQQLQLRLGYLAGYDNRGITLGAGIRKSAFRFDYSYTPFDQELGNGQRFSLYLAL